jgi:DNA-binding NarL/FixJ family response regulator
LKILVVDDHALVREGLRQVLKGLDEAVEVLEAPHCARAFELADQHPDLDLVLLDYHLPDLNGLDALQVFGKEHPELPIIMLSGSVNPQIMRQVMARGAAAFLTKSGLSHELLTVLKLVLAGEVYSPPEMAADAGLLGGSAAVGNNGTRLQLTPRQEEVLYLLLGGSTNKEISRVLQLSEETVKNHVSGIFRCFGVQSRTQAVIAATQLGYAKPASSV